MFLVISLIFPKLLPVYMYISVFLFCLYLVILVFDCIVMFEPFFLTRLYIWVPLPLYAFLFVVTVGLHPGRGTQGPVLVWDQQRGPRPHRGGRPQARPCV